MARRVLCVRVCVRLCAWGGALCPRWRRAGPCSSRNSSATLVHRRRFSCRRPRAQVRVVWPQPAAPIHSCLPPPNPSGGPARLSPATNSQIDRGTQHFTSTYFMRSALPGNEPLTPLTKVISRATEHDNRLQLSEITGRHRFFRQIRLVTVRKNGRALIFQTDTPNNRPKPLVIATDARQRSSTTHTASAKSQSTQNDLLCLYSPAVPFRHK